MIRFPAGAMRPALHNARLAPNSAASDLVRRTLARHGLMADPGGIQTPGASKGLSATFDGLAGLQSWPGNPAAADTLVPEGAEFRQGQFSCTTGTRAFRTYVPASAKSGVTGLVVMLHGCTQTPEDFAAGTGMNALAETYSFVAVYPQQSRGDNAQSCWNWFSRGDQRRDKGEPAILAGLTRRIMAEHGVSKDRTFVVGLSAGAAMAVILGETYPDVFSGVGAHSGLPFGAARDVPSAFAAMAGNGQDVSRPAPSGAAVPTIVFHGSADTTVNPVNGDRIAQDVMARGSGVSVETDAQGVAANRSFRRRITAGADGVSELEHWLVDGLGHAWSGGQPHGSYTDPHGPDASAEMIRFFFELSNRKS